MLDIMVSETAGQKLKRIREEFDLSKYKLAQLSGVSRPLISLIESGKRPLKFDTAQKLAPVLKTTPQYLMGLEGKEQETDKLIAERVREMLRVAAKDVSSQISDMMEMVVLGRVPAGYPLPNEQEGQGKILIPKDQLGAARDARHLFALIVTGDSLIGDKIYPGFHVAINPDDKEIIPGKIYLVRIDNEVTIKHVILREGRPILQASNGDYKEIVPDNLEVLGRVVWAGSGRSL